MRHEVSGLSELFVYGASAFSFGFVREERFRDPTVLDDIPARPSRRTRPALP